MVCYLSHEELSLEPKFKNIAKFINAINENPDARMAFSVMALVKTEEIESYIYPFLEDEDMYIQERAIDMIGFYEYEPARNKLIELTKTAMHNGLTAAKIALKKLDEAE